MAAAEDADANGAGAVNGADGALNGFRSPEDAVDFDAGHFDEAALYEEALRPTVQQDWLEAAAAIIKHCPDLDVTMVMPRAKRMIG